MFDRWHKKEKPLQGLAGMGGGVVSRVLGGALGPFQASGGTKSGPTGGYFYHEFTSNGTFEVTDGIADIEVILQGAGGQGGGGAGYSGGGGGGGGGGGATGVWTITGVTIATHPVSIAAGRDHPGGTNNGDPGQSTTLTLPGSGYVRSGGGGGATSGNNSPSGGGGSGGSNSDPWAAATLTGDYPGGNGSNKSGDNGGNGGEAGGKPQSPTLWWRPYISPGAGGGGGGGKGANRGGGGGGGNAGVPAGHKGGSTAGICVIRYPDAV